MEYNFNRKIYMVIGLGVSGKFSSDLTRVEHLTMLHRNFPKIKKKLVVQQAHVHFYNLLC